MNYKKKKQYFFILLKFTLFTTQFSFSVLSYGVSVLSGHYTSKSRCIVFVSVCLRWRLRPASWPQNWGQPPRHHAERRSRYKYSRRLAGRRFSVVILLTTSNKRDRHTSNSGGEDDVEDDGCLLLLATFLPVTTRYASIPFLFIFETKPAVTAFSSWVLISSTLPTFPRLVAGVDLVLS